MLSAGGRGGGGGTYCRRRRALGALRRRGGTCSTAGRRRWCFSRGPCRGGRQTWRGTRRSGRAGGRGTQRGGRRRGGTWRRAYNNERCSNRIDVSLLSPADNPGLCHTRRPRGFRAIINIRDFPPSLLHITPPLVVLTDARATPLPGDRAHAPAPSSPRPLRPSLRPVKTPHSEYRLHPPNSPLTTCQFCEKCRRPPASRILASLHTRPKKRKRPSPEDDEDDIWSDSELVHILQGWVTVRLLNTPDAQMLSTMSTVQTVCRRLPLWLSVVQSEKDGSRVAPRARSGCTWKG